MLCLTQYSLLHQVKEGLIARQKELKMGDVMEFDTFMAAVIDAKAFARISGYIDHAKASPNLNIIAGGNYDDRCSYIRVGICMLTALPPSD